MPTQILTVDESGIDLKEICKFYRENWPREIALSLEKFYKWQFQENIYNPGKDYSVVAINNDNLIGIMSLNSRPFITNKKEFKGAELSVWLIKESFQGKGIGAKILKYITNEYDFLVGVSITEPAIPVYQRMGYIFNKYIPRVLRLNPLLELPEWIETTNLGKKLIKQRSENFDIDLSYELINRKEVIKEDCSEILKDHSNHSSTFSTDPIYLNWRYIKHPVFKYKIYKIKNNLDGKKLLIIGRVHQCLDGKKIFHITDIIGNPKNYILITPFIDRYILDNQISIADFSCTKTSLISLLRRFGWFSVLDEDSVYCPNLFFPIESRSPATTSIVSKSKIEFGYSPCLDEVYFTKKECALDLPTKAAYDYLDIPFI